MRPADGWWRPPPARPPRDEVRQLRGEPLRGDQRGHAAPPRGAPPRQQRGARGDDPRRGREGEGGVGEGGVPPRARPLALLRPPLVVEDVEDGHGEQAHRHHRHQPQDRALDPPVAEDGPLPAAALAAAASVSARRGGRAAGGLDGASVGEAG